LLFLLRITGCKTTKKKSQKKIFVRFLYFFNNRPYSAIIADLADCQINCKLCETLFMNEMAKFSKGKNMDRVIKRIFYYVENGVTDQQRFRFDNFRFDL